MAVTIQSNPKSGGNVGPRPANQKLIYTLDESTATTPERFIVQVYECDRFFVCGPQRGELELALLDLVILLDAW